MENILINQYEDDSYLFTADSNSYVIHPRAMSGFVSNNTLEEYEDTVIEGMKNFFK